METSIQDLEKKALSLPEKVKAIEVRDNSSLERANKALIFIKAVRKEISDFCDPNIKRLHEAHKEALVQKKKFEKPLIEAEGYIKSQISSYIAEIERKRREAEEAVRKAEEERKRIEEEKLRAVIEAEENGDNQRAEEILNEEIPEDKPILIQPKPKLEGISIRKIPKWKIINEKLIPKEFMMVDSAKITSLVRTTKGEIRIPGIEVYFESSVASRHV